jgi:hypothetical protein
MEKDSLALSLLTTFLCLLLLFDRSFVVVDVVFLQMPLPYITQPSYPAADGALPRAMPRA